MDSPYCQKTVCSNHNDDMHDQEPREQIWMRILGGRCGVTLSPVSVTVTLAFVRLHTVCLRGQITLAVECYIAAVKKKCG